MSMKDLDRKLESLRRFQQESEKVSALTEGHVALWKVAVMSKDGVSETEHRQKIMQLTEQRLDIMARVLTENLI